MSYYDYDPNCDFYMYDEPDFDFYFEDPPIPYHLARKRKHRDKRNIMLKPDEVNTFPYNQFKPKYLVPVFYAPTKVSDPCKFERHVQENIDLYYSDRRNIEKEARLFNSYAQPQFYASTIQEETESSTCIESCTVKDDSEDMRSYKPIVINNKRNKVDPPERCQDGCCNYKTHRIKKKCKATQKITIGVNKLANKPMMESCKSDKAETSNSWTTLISGSCVTNKDTKVSEPTKETNDTISVNLSVKKSKSVMSLREKSKTNVKFKVNDENTLKDASQNRQETVQAVRDTDKIVSDNVNKMKNQTYENVANVQSMAIPNNKNTSEVVGWKNTTMQQDSSTTQSSKISYSQELKSNPTIPDISDSTDITINTEEYKDFLKSMNTANNIQNIPYYYFPNYKSMETLTENSDLKYKVPANSSESSDTFYNKMVCAKRLPDERRCCRRRINPLVDVPLSISKKALYTPTFLISETSRIRNSDGNCYSISKSSCFAVKIFRKIAGFIGCFQNYAYKYVLRFILFI